jgi:signal peptidase I
MADFTLNSKKFCSLVTSTCANMRIRYINIKGFGSSMSPFIKNGNILTIKPVNRGDAIKRGDIAIVIGRNKENLIVHRVIGLKNSFFQIKGDNCYEDDGWFPKASILGIVTEVTTEANKKIVVKRWQNLIIAFLSKIRLLNIIILPVGRIIKKKSQKLFIGNYK